MSTFRRVTFLDWSPKRSDLIFSAVNVKHFGLAVTGARLLSRPTADRVRFGSPLSSKVVLCLRTLSLVVFLLTINEALKWLTPLHILMQNLSAGGRVVWWNTSSLRPQPLPPSPPPPPPPLPPPPLPSPPQQHTCAQSRKKEATWSAK